MKNKIINSAKKKLLPYNDHRLTTYFNTKMKTIILSFSLVCLLFGSCSYFQKENPDEEFDTMYQGGAEDVDKKINNLTTKVMNDENTNTAEDTQLAMPKAGDTIAVMETNMGTIKFKFFEEAAPNLSKNFIELSKRGYYDGLIFHRVIKEFMIQGGDPMGTGMGGESYTGEGLADEPGALALKHFKGAVACAKSSLPNSIGSQFFIVHERSPHLDGSYSVFGQVYEGMEVVDKIANVATDAGDMPVEKVIMEKVSIETYEG